MKKSAFLFFVILQFGCNTTKEISKDSIDISNAKKEMEDERDSEKINATVPYKETIILLGKANRVGFAQTPFQSWFDKNFESYEFDKATIEKLKPLLKDVTIKTFMGTWCGDSKRETPRLYKILDAVNFNYDNFTLITVSRQKNTPSGFEKGFNIIRVPTIIFYKKGKEMGRFVEFAQESLEKDMLAIVSGTSYKHSYED